MNYIKLVERSYDQIGIKYQNLFSSKTRSTAFLKNNLSLLNKKNFILDAGCGTGLPAAKLLVKNGYKVIGVDISKKMIKIAKKQVGSANFIKMDIRKLRFKDNYFGGIISFFSLVHLNEKDVEIAILEFVRVLKPRGIFILGVTEGNFNDFDEFIGTKMYLHSFNFKQLLQKLTNHGFKVIKINRVTITISKKMKEKQIYFICELKK